MNTLAVLLVDDDEDDYLLTSDYLRDIKNQKFEVTWASTYEQGLVELSERHFDICFFDFLLGARTGLDLLRIAQDLRVRTPIILLTGKGNAQLDAEALRLGVTDYLVKGELDAEKLERSIRYALERTVALRALRDSEEKYRGIFEGSMDVICLMDATGKFTDINDSASRLLGFEKSELLTKNIQDIFRFTSDKTLFWSKIQQQKSIRDFEVELLTSKGESCHCILACTRMTTPGKPGEVFFQAVFHDITRRKKAEQDLLIAEKLAATSHFVRMLAHEIRNPLTNIDLSVSQIRTDLVDPEIRDYLEIIDRNSKRIGTLLTDLLQSSNPGQLELKACRPETLLDQALEIVADRIMFKKIKVSKQYQESDLHIKADPEKLKIALINIILNAVEIVASESGELFLTTGISPDGFVTLHIQDNGPGIPAEHFKRVFEPYFSRKSNGLGLGLASTLNIVQLHGGRVEVANAQTGGAIFTVMLPLENLPS